MIEIASEFLSFDASRYKNIQSATHLVAVIAKRTDVELGTIRWLTKWRQYVFHPAPGTTFNHRCLDDIRRQLVSMMDEWAASKHSKTLKPNHGKPKFNAGLKAARRAQQRKAGETRYIEKSAQQGRSATKGESSADFLKAPFRNPPIS